MLSLILILVLIGVGMYLINRYVPMQAPYKHILNTVVIIAVVLWLLSAFGVFAGLKSVPVPRIGGTAIFGKL